MSAQDISTLIHNLGQPNATVDARRFNLRRFANLAGWHPSEELLDYPRTSSFSSSHIVVEFGLENTAVLSFLNHGQATADLSADERNSLLSLSYNNLVDWHLVPDVNGLSVFHNRTEEPWLRYISRLEVDDPWSATAFDRIRRIKLTTTQERLDDALIKTISHWRLELRALLAEEALPQDLSAFFNLILFVRASEDQQRWQGSSPRPTVMVNQDYPFTEIARERLRTLLGHRPLPAYLEGYLDRARKFDGISAQFVQQILDDFTHNKFIPQYEYDFSIISKHALSLIYERYVALFRESPTSANPSLFPDLPTEISNKDIGAVYTPQYIARFFARFIEYHRPKRALADAKVIDPACGSGIFLRTYLETVLETFSSAQVYAPEDAFLHVSGLDSDASAVDATVLSLALLHLIATDRLPEDLDVRHVNSLDSFRSGDVPRAAYDVAIANPPFVSWDRLDRETRHALRSILNTAGRPDLFTGFIKIGQELLRPGGLFLYVVPHAFLLSDSCEAIRESFEKDFTIHMVVDLSTVRVFESVSTYVVLLIAEKQAPPSDHETTIVRCHDRVGRALAEALSGRLADTSFYQIFRIPQAKLQKKAWNIRSDMPLELTDKLSALPSLDELASIHEGMITGADDVFIVPRSVVPSKEKAIWMPFLSDREMGRFGLPKTASSAVFYPYLKGGKKLDLSTLKAEFPETWSYLRKHQKFLRDRKSIKANPESWWLPVRPRTPTVMRSPKIVAPHLVSAPKFSVDVKGQFAVSRCPIVIPREFEGDPDILDYYCAILNSSVALFQLSSVCHVYDRGYFMLEPKSLKQLRVPAFYDIDAFTRRQLVNYAAQLRQSSGDPKMEATIDRIVADVYELTDAERDSVGVLK